MWAPGLSPSVHWVGGRIHLISEDASNPGRQSKAKLHCKHIYKCIWGSLCTKTHTHKPLILCCFLSPYLSDNSDWVCKPYFRTSLLHIHTLMQIHTLRQPSTNSSLLLHCFLENSATRTVEIWVRCPPQGYIKRFYELTKGFKKQQSQACFSL